MDTRGVRQDMAVRSADGEKLGKVVECGQDRFIVEKGFFFPKDYTARYDEVAEIRDGEVLLRDSAGALRERSGSGVGGGVDQTEMGTGATEQVSVPVAEEELTAEKRARQAGEVTIHKDVTTERRQITVPVTKEEVHVERVPAGEDAKPGDAAFQRGTISVPVREEEVEIHKRPVVREQVKVSKTAHPEERVAEADVRKEKVDVEEGGDLGRTREEPPE